MIDVDDSNPSPGYGFERRGERRRRQRLNWGKALTFGEEFLSECMIANLTSTGACLRIARRVEIPRYFLLYIDLSGAVLEGETMWRHGSELGCKLVDAPRIVKAAVGTRMHARYYGL